MALAEHAVYVHPGPWVHPMLREQLYAAPDGFRYVWSHPDLDDPDAGTPRMAAGGDRFSGAVGLARRARVRTLGAAGRVQRSQAPDVRAALIHSSQQLFHDAQLHYVVDVEHVQAFTLFQRPAVTRASGRARLVAALGDDRLRWLLPWSDAAGRSVLAAVPAGRRADIAEKLRTVYPSFRPAVDRPATRDDGPLRVLFVGAAFYEKGGVETVEAMRRLRGSYDVRLDLVSFVPRELVRHVHGQAGITVHPTGIRRDALEALYRAADVFIFPSHMDTFGIVVGEAMGHGLPVVASDQFALPELVEHGVSGLLVEHEHSMWAPDGLARFPYLLPTPRSLITALRAPSDAYVGRLTVALAQLAEDRALVHRLGEGALEQVRRGRLSVDRRRAALAEIYADALAA